MSRNSEKPTSEALHAGVACEVSKRSRTDAQGASPKSRTDAQGATQKNTTATLACKKEYYTMMQVCREANMSYQTLKFYCNKGLVPNVKRDKNNRRIFSEYDLNWIKSLKCLKNCGLSINEMLEYLELCLQGEKSIPERKVMLAEKRKNLEAEMKQIQESIDYIDWKQNFYDEVLAGKTEYFSYLIPADTPHMS